MEEKDVIKDPPVSQTPELQRVKESIYPLQTMLLSGPEDQCLFFFLPVQNIKTSTSVKDPSFATFHVYRWPGLAILNVKGIGNLVGGKHSQKQKLTIKMNQPSLDVHHSSHVLYWSCCCYRDSLPVNCQPFPQMSWFSAQRFLTVEKESLYLSPSPFLHCSLPPSHCVCVWVYTLYKYTSILCFMT